MIEKIVIRSKQTDKESPFETGSPVTTNGKDPITYRSQAFLCYFLDCCITNTRKHDIWNIFCASIAQEISVADLLHGTVVYHFVPSELSSSINIFLPTSFISGS